MSIQEKRLSDRVYSYGWLVSGSLADDARPRGLHGVVKNECGLAAVSVFYYGPRGGPWSQFMDAEIVIDGRLLSLQQKRSTADFLTERGIKTVVGRWLREIGA